MDYGQQIRPQSGRTSPTMPADLHEQFRGVLVAVADVPRRSDPSSYGSQPLTCALPPGIAHGPKHGGFGSWACHRG